MQNRDLKRRAIHESGHAFIRYLVGTGIEEISIKSSPEGLGHVLGRTDDIKEGLDPNSPEFATEQKYILVTGVAIAIAGLLASHIYDGEPEEMDFEGSSEDMLVFMDYLDFARTIPGLKENAFIKDIKKMVLDWLKDNWSAVESLSEALLKSEHLSKDEASQIIKNNLKGQV